MNAQSKMAVPDREFPLFSLPTEIRFMVYREVWLAASKPGTENSQEVSSSEGQESVPDDADDSDDYDDTDSDGPYDSDSDNEEGLEVVTQRQGAIVSLSNLFNTCRKIRKDLTTEFFTGALKDTQIHLANPYHPPPNLHTGRRNPLGYRVPTISPIARQKFAIFEALKFHASSMFTEHTQHVSLHWGGCFCEYSVRGSYYPSEVLDWLLECEQLKTLEIVFTDPLAGNLQFAKGWVPGRVRWGLWQEDDLFCDWCQKKLAKVLGTVEKAIGRFWCPAGRNGVPTGWRKTVVFRENGQWKDTGFFREEREAAEAEKGNKTAPVVKSSSEYRFKHHIGAVDVVWPLMDTL